MKDSWSQHHEDPLSAPPSEEYAAWDALDQTIPASFMGPAAGARRSALGLLKPDRRVTPATTDPERNALLAQVSRDVVRDWHLKSNRMVWGENLQAALGHRPCMLGSLPHAWLDLIHPEDRDRVSQRMQDEISGAAMRWELDYRFLHGDGSYRHIHEICAAQRDKRGNARRVMASLADVSERRRLEEQLRQAQKMHAIDELSSGIAHDFNNLLTVILGNAELLMESLGAQEQARVLAQRTYEAAERGAALTARLNAFARKQHIAPQVTEVNLLIGGMDDLLRRSLATTIEVVTPDTTPLWPVKLDVGQFEVALLNLVINARDAMPAGGKLSIATSNVTLGTLHTSCAEDCLHGDYVCVAVSDTGTGMSPAILAQATEMFFTTKKVGEGSGLGLSLVHGFAKQSRGHVEISSSEGQGTTVSLYFPRCQP